MRPDWDAIVVGASFGGLAAAMGLAGAGRVLLIDRDPVGEGQTSACGTLLRVLERLGALEAVEQVHEELVLHLPDGGTRRFRPRYPFATFDYATLCRLLFARTDATFLRASVLGLEGGKVRTTEGVFGAPVLIDASGWRAVLGSSRHPGLVPVEARSLGVELQLPVRDEGLHFWVLPPEIGCGVIWLFPAGERSRTGIACYRGRGRLKPRLEAFLGDCLPAGMHGGFFPSRLRQPVAGEVFLVGDAAGQCLPLTGEGIRPALVFGQAAGRLAREVVEGRVALADALVAYRRLVVARRPHYRLLELLQRGILRAPRRLLPGFVGLFADGPASGPAQRAYWWLADPDTLRPGQLRRPRGGSSGEEEPMKRYDVYTRFARRHLATGVERAVYLTLVSQLAESWSAAEIAEREGLDPAKAARVLEEFRSAGIVDALDGPRGRRYRWCSDMDYLFRGSADALGGVDPVCGMPVAEESPYVAHDAYRRLRRFCSSLCLAVFRAFPSRFSEPPSDVRAAG